MYQYLVKHFRTGATTYAAAANAEHAARKQSTYCRYLRETDDPVVADIRIVRQDGDAPATFWTWENT